MKTKVTSHPPDPTLLKRGQLAKRYSVAPRTIADWQASGFIPHVKLTKKCVRFPVAKCDAIVESLTRSGNGGVHV